MALIGVYTVKAQTQVVFYTNMGNFTVQMEDSLAPITSGNFLSLVKQQYYDGVIFHRVIDNFMIQGGDPTGTGSGGPGYTIEDEFHIDLSNVRGTISMANSGPNTGGSQFFINLVNNTYLDFNKSPFSSKHPVFGKVTDSFEVVQRIGDVSTNSSDRPINEVRMDSIRELRFYSAPPEINVKQAKVYPNPVVSAPYILIPKSDNQTEHFNANTIHIQCINGHGLQVWSKAIPIKSGQVEISLGDLYKENLVSGIYILRILESPSGSAEIKIVIP